MIKNLWNSLAGWKIYLSIGIISITSIIIIYWYIIHLQDSNKLLSKEVDGLKSSIVAFSSYIEKYEVQKKINEKTTNDLLALSEGMDDHETKCVVPDNVRNVIGKL